MDDRAGDRRRRRASAQHHRGHDLAAEPLVGAALPSRPIFYYSDRELEAVRVGRFKLHARHGVYGGAPWSFALAPLAKQGPWLFDLGQDPDEAYDVHEKYPEELSRIESVRAAWLRALVEDPRGWK
jgi:hypothetical protein